MTFLSKHRRAFCTFAFATLACAAPALSAQLSLASAVDLALRNSPRVKSSEADVQRARASLRETKDVFIPSISAGSNLGQGYGYSNYPPTFFSVSANSLIYSGGQSSYIRSASDGLDAAQQTLMDVREGVAEDAANSFVALDHDQQREAVLGQQFEYAGKLLSIVQDRFDAGLSSKMNLLDAQLSVANLRFARLRAQNDSANDRAHLARLLGIPPGSLRADDGFPAGPISAADSATTRGYANASVAAAFATARAREDQARGDARFLYRPQVSFFSQYNRYATFTNSFKDLQKQYSANEVTLGANESAFGVQISIPLLDRVRHSKALESAADANRALHDAEFAQMNVLDVQGRLNHTIELVQAQAEIASLEQQRAQEQLEIVRVQMANANASPQPLTPADEQNSLINEREKYLAVIDAAFQLRQAEISLLRQTGHLEDWLMHSGSSATPQPPSTTVKNP